MPSKRVVITGAAGFIGSHLSEALLDRGYSITHKLPDGHIVKDAAALEIGDLVRITLALGKAVCRVQGKE